MANFVVFQKGMPPVDRRLLVTIQKRGTFSLNRAAYQALEQPKAVEFLYDEETQIVGLRAADPTFDNSFAVTPTSEAGSTFSVAGRGFIRYIGLDTTRAIRRTATLDDGALCIDLKDKGEAVFVRRRQRQDASTPPPAETADPLGRPFGTNIGKVTRFDH